jgi:hypothetical protein
MAAILPIFQRYEELKAGQDVIGVHQLRLVSSSDTFTVPRLTGGYTGAQDTTNTVAVAQLEGVTDSTVTVTSSNAFTVVVAGGSAGDLVTIVTRSVNRWDFGPEDVGTDDSGLDVGSN